MKPAARIRQEAASAALVTQYSGACMLVLLLGTVCWALLPFTGYVFSALVFLMAIALAGTRWNRGPVILMALLCALVWNFIYIPPRFTLHIAKPEDAVMFILFFVVALAMGHLIARLREREEALERHHQEREALLAERHRADLLAESERLHRTLLDSVSHELKTPIAVIRAALDGLGTSDPYAVEIGTATRRLQRIVDSFLEMTRVESEALTPRPDWCEISDIVYAATTSLELELRDHPVVTGGMDDIPLLHVDSRLLAQALGNVIHNAAIHGPAGTPIQLDAKLHTNEDGATHLDLSVRDHGPGLSPTAIRHAFDKFFRAPGAPAGGTGLGLAIARGLVRALGGGMSAGNHPEGGAVFNLSLPVRIHQETP